MILIPLTVSGQPIIAADLKENPKFIQKLSIQVLLQYIGLIQYTVKILTQNQQDWGLVMLTAWSVCPSDMARFP